MRKKILIIKHGALGDIILASKSLLAIRKQNQDALIVVLTTKPYLDLLAKSPWVDEVKIDLKPKWFNFIGVYKLIRWLINYNFDEVYELQTSDRSGFYFYLIPRNKKPNWNGIVYGCSHRHVSSNRTTLHTLDRLAEQLNLSNLHSSYRVNWDWLRADLSKFNLPDNICLLVPGGSVHRKEKIWPSQRFANLSKIVSNFGYNPVIIGGKNEKNIAMSIQSINPSVINLVDKTSLAEVAQISRLCKLAVGNDTGPMHLINECSSPRARIVVLFGSDSNPDLCAPRGKKVKVLRRDSISDITVKSVISATNIAQ